MGSTPQPCSPVCEKPAENQHKIMAQPCLSLAIKRLDIYLTDTGREGAGE
jgi:hypothetical protein